MSTNNGSVAPKERINVKYVPATGDQQAEKELPLNLLVTGDFKGRTEETSLEERAAISIDKNNFDNVMENAEINLAFSVPNKLSEKDDDELAINLDIESLKDFTPDEIVKKIPELQKLLALRESLVALKGPLGNVPAFRKQLQDMIANENMRDQLLSELDLVVGKEDK